MVPVLGNWAFRRHKKNCARAPNNLTRFPSAPLCPPCCAFSVDSVACLLIKLIIINYFSLFQQIMICKLMWQSGVGSGEWGVGGGREELKADRSPLRTWHRVRLCYIMKKSADETRFLLTGRSEAGRVLVVSHMDREELTRIMSAREATRKERNFYEESR